MVETPLIIIPLTPSSLTTDKYAGPVLPEFVIAMPLLWLNVFAPVIVSAPARWTTALSSATPSPVRSALATAVTELTCEYASVENL